MTICFDLALSSGEVEINSATLHCGQGFSRPFNQLDLWYPTCHAYTISAIFAAHKENCFCSISLEQIPATCCTDPFVLRGVSTMGSTSVKISAQPVRFLVMHSVGSLSFPTGAWIYCNDNNIFWGEGGSFYPSNTLDRTL